MKNANNQFSNIANLINSGNIIEAKSSLSLAIQEFGLSHNSYFYSGAIAFSENRIESAVNNFKEAFDLEPNNMQTVYNYGMALSSDQLFSDAMRCFRTVLNQLPNHVPSLIMVARIFERTGNPITAKSTANLILKLSPNSADALEVLAGSAKNTGEMVEAVNSYEKLLNLYPNHFEARSSLLFSSNYRDIPAQEIRDIHIKHGKMWQLEDLMAQPKKVPISNKITIGYVSPDYGLHSVTYFLESILKNHNHDNFKIISYSNTAHPDEVTTRLKTYFDKWRDINNLQYKTIANMIKEDGVDILIDLAGHTGGNSLLAFAIKPAPIQLSYIGYPASTGIESIDYRITDKIADPITENFEPLIRLTKSFLAYTPPTHLPETDFTATKNRNHTLFGSFNNTAKYSDKTIKLWSKLLKAVTHSKLLIKHRHFNDPKLRELVLNRFKSEGISDSQIIFKEYSFTNDGHLKEYHNIDIALDSTPYNGTTTTYEAAIMGVPTISIRGKRHSDRVGASILINLKLDNFLAETDDQFVEIGKYFDKNRDELIVIKSSLRERLLSSPLCDGKGLTKELEDIYEKLILDY